jgi:hypothetical protein
MESYLLDDNVYTVCSYVGKLLRRTPHYLLVWVCLGFGGAYESIISDHSYYPIRFGFVLTQKVRTSSIATRTLERLQCLAPVRWKDYIVYCIGWTVI